MSTPFKRAPAPEADRLIWFEVPVKSPKLMVQSAAPGVHPGLRVSAGVNGPTAST